MNGGEIAGVNSDRPDAAAMPSVGIVWGVRGGAEPLVLVTDCTPLAKAEPYSGFLTHPGGHHDVWEGWRRLGPAGLIRRGLPSLIACMSTSTSRVGASCSTPPRAASPSTPTGSCKRHACCARCCASSALNTRDVASPRPALPNHQLGSWN